MTGLSVEYLKKARGTLLAESRVEVPPVTAEMEYDVTAEIRDAEGDVVATMKVRWRLGPKPETGSLTSR